MWTWRFESATGAQVPLPELAEEFPSQADAETWVGETYPELLTRGVEQVTLFEGDREVYGPMSLRPVR